MTTARWATWIAAGLALLMCATTPLLARASGGSGDYYTTIIKPLAPDSWASGHSSSGTAWVAPGGSPTNCVETTPIDNGTSNGTLQVVSFNSYGCGSGGSEILMNKPGPFAGDVNDGGPEVYGNQTTSTPWIGTSNALQQHGDTTDETFSFWFRPAMVAGGAYQSVMCAGCIDPVDNSGTVSLIPDKSQLYIASYNDFQTLCFGRQSAPDGWEGVSGGYPKVERCVPFAGSIGQWVLLTLHYTGCGRNTPSCTLGLSIDDKMVQAMTGLYAHSGGEQNGPVYGGGAGGSGYVGDFWGFADWSQGAADAMYTQANVAAMFYAPGTGESPGTGTVYQGVGGLPGGPDQNGNCPSGSSVAILSGECKFQVGHVGTTNCAAESAGHNWWDVGADVTTALCYLGNVFIGAFNGLIDAINVLIDLVLPGGAFFAPIQNLQSALTTHAPFSYVASGLTAISNALSAPAQSVSLHLGGVTSATDSSVNINGSLSFLDPFRAPMVAMIWLGTLVAIIRNARADVSGGDEA